MLSVAELLRSGRLEVVPADRATAAVRLARAEQHLDTAAALIGHDNEVAYGSLYDAARRAVTAHMLANGLRAPAKPGAHEAVGIYAVIRLTDPSSSVLQRLRRNRSEYDDIIVGRQDVETDLQHARGHCRCRPRLPLTPARPPTRSASCVELDPPVSHSSSPRPSCRPGGAAAARSCPRRTARGPQACNGVRMS